MVVIAHQAIPKHVHAPQIMGLGERLKEPLVVFDLQEGPLPSPPIHDVVGVPRKLNPKRPTAFSLACYASTRDAYQRSERNVDRRYADQRPPCVGRWPPKSHSVRGNPPAIPPRGQLDRAAGTPAPSRPRPHRQGGRHLLLPGTAVRLVDPEESLSRSARRVGQDIPTLR